MRTNGFAILLEKVGADETSDNDDNGAFGVKQEMRRKF